MTLDRRTFLASSIAAGAALAAPAIRAAEDKKVYRTALLGSGWWGTNILREALASGRSKLVALCDVDQAQLKTCQAEVNKLTGDQPKHYEDFREVLDKEKPEICIIGAPDHWHPLMMIAAVRAGAHVYVEKPVSHTILEGVAMVRAARDTGRTVQVGTHRRVSPHCVSGQKFLRSPQMGKIGMVRAFVHYPGDAGTRTPDSQPPTGLNWDMWCGPAPLCPYNKDIHPKGFRHFLDYANGQLGDWGIHWMDQIMWSTDEKFPKKVSSFGSRHIRKDTTTAPDTQVASFEFDSFTATWEHRQYAANEAERHSIGCYFYGTGGTLHIGWLDGWTFYPAKKGGKIIHEDAKLNEPDAQNIKELWADFLAAIASKKPPVSDIEVGHRSTNMSLLGMLSLKLGRSIQWDGDKHQIPGDAEANKLLRREYRKPWVYPEV
jgi:predicted dehydrogenase